MNLKLSNILEIIEFEYIINNDNTLSLKDQLKANLNHIENEKFIINKNIATTIIDRLDIYIQDYIIDDYIEILNKECNENLTNQISYQELLEKIQKYPDKFHQDDYQIMKALNEPDKFIDISEVTNAI